VIALKVPIPITPINSIEQAITASRWATGPLRTMNTVAAT
jgi:hypothetical protein